jgi:hypothetical protein
MTSGPAGDHLEAPVFRLLWIWDILNFDTVSLTYSAASTIGLTGNEGKNTGRMHSNTEDRVSTANMSCLCGIMIYHGDICMHNLHRGSFALLSKQCPSDLGLRPVTTNDQTSSNPLPIRKYGSDIGFVVAVFDATQFVTVL